jgi:holo-[acyl-carrier protein] synthase
LPVKGIGLDLVDLQRFQALYGAGDSSLLDRCFTSGELVDAGSGEDRFDRLAARFAAKEAVLKLIGGLEDGLALTDIEIKRLPGGQPTVILHRVALSRAKDLGIGTVLLSLTHSAASAAAVAVALSEEGPR